MAGPETEKPRRPNRVVSALGTMRSPRLAKRRFRRPALEETATQSSCRSGADQTVQNEEADLELRPDANWKPMKLASNAGRNMGELRFPQNDIAADQATSYYHPFLSLLFNLHPATSTLLQADIQSTIFLYILLSRCSNHLNLKRLTTSATLSIIIRLYGRSQC